MLYAVKNPNCCWTLEQPIFLGGVWENQSSCVVFVAQYDGETRHVTEKVVPFFVEIHLFGEMIFQMNKILHLIVSIIWFWLYRWLAVRNNGTATTIYCSSQGYIAIITKDTKNRIYIYIDGSNSMRQINQSSIQPQGGLAV